MLGDPGHHLETGLRDLRGEALLLIYREPGETDFELPRYAGDGAPVRVHPRPALLVGHRFNLLLREWASCYQNAPQLLARH